MGESYLKTGSTEIERASVTERVVDESAMSTDDMYGLNEESGSDHQENAAQESPFDRDLRRIGTMMQIAIAACENDETDWSQTDIRASADELADDVDQFLSGQGLSDVERVLTLWKVGLSVWDDEMPHIEMDDLIGETDPEEMSQFQTDLLKISMAVQQTIEEFQASDDADLEMAFETARDTAASIRREILIPESPQTAAVIWLAWGMLLEYANNEAE